MLIWLQRTDRTEHVCRKWNVPFSFSKLHIDDVRSDISTRRLGNQPSRKNVFRHTHTHTQTASPAWGVERPVSLEMPVEMLNSLFTHYLAKRQESWQMEVLKHINHLPLWADKHLIWLMTPEDQNKYREIKAGRGRRRGKLKRAHWPPGGLSGVQQGRLLLRLPVMCSCPHAD